MSTPTASFPVHTLASAPTASKPLLERVATKYGFVPNLLAVLAEAPAALQGYLGLSQQFSESSLSPADRDVVLLTVARANGCHYCVAVHSMMATMAKLPAPTIAAIRDDRPIDDAALEALRLVTRAIVLDRGHPSDDLVARFLAAGYKPHQLLEVLVGVALKTLSNYTNHLAHTPLDAAFAAHRWEPAAP